MFSNLWSFVKRHRRKFIFTGCFVGGAILLGRYARKKFSEYQENEANECLINIRRQHHFDSNQRTCNTTVLSMLPSLRDALHKKLDTESLTAELRNKPVNKIEIWEQLKILSFTRTFVSVYSCCMLVVCLRVQLNILGGYMYLDTLHGKNGLLNNAIYATSDVQKKYLAGIQYLFEQGLDELINDVKSAVGSVLSELSLKQAISVATLQDIIGLIRRKVEYHQHNGYHDGTPSSLCRYMVASSNDSEPQQACSLTRDEILLSRLNNETRDMMNSYDFHSITTMCLDAGFARLLENAAEFFRPTNMSTDESLQSANLVSMPLAKVIPVVNGQMNFVLSDAPNPFLQELLQKEQVKDFAANVYEAFCNLQDSKCSID